MTVLIATDVFGITPAVNSLARSLGGKCQLVSPFEDNTGAFHSEQKAYHAFVAQGGVAGYAGKLRSLLQESVGQIRFAIGFSAGASALWLGSEAEEFGSLQQLTLFYGSRIRDYASLKPRCPARLIFAEREPAFDAAALVAELGSRGHRAEVAKNTSHGFMNPYSGGYCVKSNTRYIEELAAMLRAGYACSAKAA
ncbi:hypothetical protein [Undibacterium sp.]|uniref:hypothetical protein n=1 Tax=Undibacterium sp. TaxID=1914977 RepID=UPI00374CB09D